MSNTPFIPPLNTPEGSPSSAPVIPGSASGGSPNMSGWGNSTSIIPGSYPMYSPNQSASPYIPTSPYVSPGVMPGQPQSRNHSRQGLSADWTGYPQGTPFVSSNVPLSGGHVPPNSPFGPQPPTGPHPNSPYTNPLHPNSPWYPPSAPAPYPAFGVGGTPWAPSQHFPPMSTPWGPAPGQLPPQSQAYTPWAHPTTIPPPAPGHPQGWGVPPPQSYFPPPDPASWATPHGPTHPPQRTRGRPEPPGQVSDRIDHFAEGDSYGPVLDPKLARIVGAQVRINPLIAPVPDEGPDPVHLKWNMLYPVSTIQRSTDPSHVSWSKGRDTPATFPRLKELRIISETIPWIIQVKATKDSRGITCAELIDAIARDLNRNTGKGDYEALPAAAKNEVRQAYKHNRSPLPHVPGGMLGQGMKRLDFLRKNTMFAGIEVNDRVVRKIFGDVMPGVFVLKCSQNYMTKKEVEEQNKRMAGERSRPSSSSKGRRSTSRAGSTSITIKSPSEHSDEEDGDDF